MTIKDKNGFTHIINKYEVKYIKEKFVDHTDDEYEFLIVFKDNTTINIQIDYDDISDDLDIMEAEFQ